MHVRSISKSPLVLAALLFACDGRVKVGTDLGASGGGVAEAGAANDGGSVNGGTSMGGSDSEGGEPNGGSPATGEGGTSSVADAGAGGEAEGPTVPQWLAVVTRVSEGSSALSIVDLTDPDSEAVLLGDGFDGSFSPDGRFLCVTRPIDSNTSEILLVDARGTQLGTPRLVGRAGPSGCVWSPDSKKLLCLDAAGTLEALVLTPETGQLVARASLPVSSGSPTWASDGSLFLTENSGLLSHVEWSSDGSANVESTGMRGVLASVSSSGDVAVFSPWDSPPGSDPPELLNLLTLAHAALGPEGVGILAPSFRSMVTIDGTADLIGVPATFSYFWFDGIHANRVASRQVMLWYDDPPRMQFVGERFAEIHDEGRLVLTTIGPEGVSSEEVPDHRDVATLTASADGRWLTFTQRDEPVGDRRPVSRWLIRLGDAGIEAVSRLGRFTKPTSASFSPDSSKLLVFGHDRFESDVTNLEPAVLFDLQASGTVTERTFDLPHWSPGTWSSNSAFYGFIAGEPESMNDAIYVLDALHPARPPRRVVGCGSNRAPGAGCRSSFQFQN